MLEVVVHSKSKTFLAFCFCFLLGVAGISIKTIEIDFVYFYGFLFAAISSIAIFWKNKDFRFLLLCLVFFTLGILRYTIAFPLKTNHISNFNGEKVEVVGFVSAEPDVRMDGVRYIVLLDGDNNGRVYFKSQLYPRYEYGERLGLECQLKLPEPIEDFRYDMYLARYGVFSICENPKIKIAGVGDSDVASLLGMAGEKEGNGVLRKILSLKNDVAARINELWHEPHASFMAGLLYGYRGGLGSLNELFSITGVTHIVAISGYNITIIATILITICVHLSIPRKKAFWFIAIGIILFVLFAGASASVVRAGIMGIIVLLAKQIGRLSRVGNVLVLTCVVMTLHNPFILIWDAGFQLSFISTLGLVYLTPVIQPWFKKIPEVLGFQESVISTLSAIIATLPLILYQFGRLSIVAVIVNVLILWIIPLIMMLGFFAVVTSFIFLPLGQIISWLAWVGLQYIIIVVEWFASLPFAAIDIRIPQWAMVVMYILIFYWIRIGQTKKPVCLGF
ncbi:MAG: ComEC/Rec2 family competence protein [Candidatus Magasanikbacteria bacterium]